MFQAELTKHNDDRWQATINEEQKRLEEAEGSVTSLIANVNKETVKVKNAMNELEDVRSRASVDPLLQIANFRNLGLVKQSAFVGSLLFLIRAISELPLAVTDANGSHGIAAVVQLGIAMACAVLFVVL